MHGTLERAKYSSVLPFFRVGSDNSYAHFSSNRVYCLKHAQGVKVITDCKERLGGVCKGDTAVGFKDVLGFRSFERGFLIPVHRWTLERSVSHFPKDAIANSRVWPFIFQPPVLLPPPPATPNRLNKNERARQTIKLLRRCVSWKRDDFPDFLAVPRSILSPRRHRGLTSALSSQWLFLPW